MTDLYAPMLNFGADCVRMPNGVMLNKPTEEHRRAAKKLTEQQETLFREYMNLGASEEAQGRALSIQRKVADLEARKHPLLQAMYAHLLK